MELAIREARAQFAKAIGAAERGERVTITRNGKVVAELGPPTGKGGLDWAKLERASKKSGLDKFSSEELWPAHFDDPAFSRKVLGDSLQCDCCSIRIS